MEQFLHTNMLFASSAVMYAYGLLSLFAISPSREEYYSYIVARKMFGVAMMILATCLLVHWHFDLRGSYPLLASSLCLVYATTTTMILSVIFTSLVQGKYPFRKRLTQIACFVISLVLVLAINYLLIPQGAQYITLITISIFYIALTVFLTMRFFRAYRKAVDRADNYYSENIGKMFEWMPTTIYLIVVLVFITAVLTIFSNLSFISFDLLLGLLVLTYVFISLQNYMINIAKMKMLLLTDEQQNIVLNNSEPIKSEVVELTSHERKAVELQLEKWVENKGFTKQGLTLDDLALELNISRANLSSHINAGYHLTFRGWIASHRIEYSKELLLSSEEFSAVTIAAMVGYSPNAFIKMFTKAEGVPPMQWRKDNRPQ